jgi:hypothetical protein
MKHYLLLLSFVLITNTLLIGQGMDHPPKDKEAAEKIYQLEKIKLIEVLQMDEETSIRFFARRAEFQRQTDEIHIKIESIINTLESIDKSGKVYTEAELISYINEFNNLHSQLGQKRTEFINSLNDILSYEQISKLIVFERKFKEELRKAFFKERRKHKPQD